MRENKPDKLRELTREEVELRLSDLQEELQTLRFRASLKQEGNPLRIRELRRDIARTKTLLHEDERGVRTLASSQQKSTP
ncbi:MAG: 50S ribosomal protein L29 [Candidatus Eisenbacteria sp.]|nr:50S ribosomal protein L29 [Candidatus Eisenbacteria bacterium]